MIRLLIVDDEPLFRQGLVELLSLEADLEVVGQAQDGTVAILLAEQFQPQVVLMDVQMPECDGPLATQTILQRYPWMRILVLTTFDDDDYIWRSLQAGALGYVLKRTPVEEIAAAIRAVHLGHGQLSPTIAPKVLSQYSPRLTKLEDHGLSDRDIEMLKLVGEGRSNQEIAQQLNLAQGTVKNYLSRILNQLHLRNRTEAALWAEHHIPK